MREHVCPGNASRPTLDVGRDEVGDPVDGLRLDAVIAVRRISVALARLGWIAAVEQLSDSEPRPDFASGQTYRKPTLGR